MTYSGNTVVLSNFLLGGVQPGSASTAGGVTEAANAVPVVAPETILNAGTSATNAESGPPTPVRTRKIPASSGSLSQTESFTVSSAMPSRDLPQNNSRSNRAGGNTPPTSERPEGVAINLESSNELLDLLEGAEPTTAEGKVTIKAVRLTKGHRGGRRDGGKVSGDTANNARHAVSGGNAHRGNSREPGSGREDVLKVTLPGRTTD